MTPAHQRSLLPAGTGGIDTQAGPGAVISVWTTVSSAARTHKQQHTQLPVCLLAFQCTYTLFKTRLGGWSSGPPNFPASWSANTCLKAGVN